MLDSRVLKLNSNYSPIGVCTARDAFELIYSNRAEVVNVEDGNYTTYDFNSWAEISELKHELEEYNDLDEFVFTSYLTLQIPRVVRTTEFSHVPHRSVKLSRKNIYSRDKNTCQYCGKVLKPSKITLDHVIPKSQGGRNSWKNLVCSCIECNHKKGPRTPKEAHMKLLHKPIEPKFVDAININFEDDKYSMWDYFISNSYWNTEIVD